MALKGRDGFLKFYQDIYKDRWPDLLKALEAPVRQVARFNGFLANDELESRAKGFALAGFAGRPAALLEEERRLQPQVTTSGIFDFYVMDAASIFAAAALDVQPDDEVLDLCAAPGGKSLILAEALKGSGRLVCNEMSDRRRARLRAVLEDYLPASVQKQVTVTAHDGSKWCLYKQNEFDRILVDAPCSGERHLLEEASEMKLWSPARSKNLAVRQYALLASALAVVRPGGRIVYSTCSISPLENDAVVARLLKKRAGEVRVVSSQFEMGESTEHGWHLLPDRTGYGPIYFSVLERV